MPDEKPKHDPTQFLFPPGTILGDAERRSHLAKAAKDVARLTVELALISRVIPGKAGRIAAKVIAGLEKDPGTGKVVPGAGTIGNFLPSPFGFLDPTAVGLKRNFYLPPGSTDYVPRLVDDVGLGFPEQRRDDQQRRLQIMNARVQNALKQIRALDDATLNKLLEGADPLTRAKLAEIKLNETTGNVELSKTLIRVELDARARAAEAVLGGQLQPAAPQTDAVGGLGFVPLALDVLLGVLVTVDQFFRENPPDP